jgi:uncharacterized protein YbjT (DUF2867 family)
MILVTGACGRVGGRVAEILADKQIPFRAMSRTPDKLRKSEIVDVIYGDFEDPNSLDKAFDGVRTALVISGKAMPGKRCFTHKMAFDAAKRAGVEHIIYLSLLGSSANSVYGYCRDHYESERFLAETGISFTSLRNAFYLDMFFEKFGIDGILRGPAADGKGAFITREDVAQVAAAALLNPPVGVVEITGPEALGLKDIAERFSHLTGTKLQYDAETIDVARSRMQGALNDEWKRELEIEWFDAIAQGEQLPVNGNFKAMTGLEPYSIEQYFEEFPHLFDILRTRRAA